MPVGQTIGTVIGAGAGSLFGAPMVGAGIGGSIGGLFDTNSANKKSKAAEENILQSDPNVTKFLKNIHDRNLSYKTGSGSSFYTDEAKKAGASAVQGALNLSGGNTGAAVSAVTGVGKGASRSVNEILANLEKENQFGTSLEANLINNIAQRKLEVNLAKYSQAQAEKAQAETDRNNMVTSLIGTADYGTTNSEKSDIVTSGSLSKEGGNIFEKIKELFKPQETKVTDSGYSTYPNTKYGNVSNFVSGLLDKSGGLIEDGVDLINF